MYINVTKCSFYFYLDSLGKHNWATDVKNVLNTNGFGCIWEWQNIVNEKVFFKELEQNLRDQFLQKWHEE